MIQEFKVRTADTVIFETVFTLQSLYKQPKAVIRGGLFPLIAFPGVVLPRKARLQLTFDYYVDLSISFADAYHAALMKELKLTETVSFNRDFNRIPGITRSEP